MGICFGNQHASSPISFAYKCDTVRIFYNSSALPTPTNFVPGPTFLHIFLLYANHVASWSVRSASKWKPQSCEPCRKSKLKCDHVLPTCGRCIQRKIGHRCIYHPAPMSRHTVGDTEASMSGLRHSSLVERVSSVGTEPLDWIGPNVHTHHPSADAGKTAGDQPAGYLGPTSQ